MRVTDHAVLRYMERVQGLDVEAVRRHIAGLCGPATAAGASTVYQEGVRFEISRTGAVVTVTPARGACRTRQRRLGMAHV